MKTLSIIGAVICAIALTVLLSSHASAQSTIIPAYNYPMTWQNPIPYWDDITTAGGSKVPIVIVNPSNGPGTSVNADYQTQMSRNKQAGIKNIGYISTNYQNRPFSQIVTDIDNYYDLYGPAAVDGIFLDEVQATDPARLCDYSKAYNYIKSTYPGAIVISNPGVHISDSNAPYADIWLTSETDYATYSSSYTPATSAFETNPANSNRIMHIVHGTSSTQYSNALNLAQSRNAGWTYVTDDLLPNPYDTLATYFSSILTEYTAPPSIPNRPAQAAVPGCDDPYAFVAQVTQSPTTPVTQQTKDS